MIREFKCPYGDDFEGGDECDRCEQYELCLETYPPVNLIEIPKGATNGDMIKAMFPNATFMIDEEKDEQGTKNLYVYTDDFEGFAVDLDWWNAPYKRGDLDGSN